MLGDAPQQRPTTNAYARERPVVGVGEVGHDGCNAVALQERPALQWTYVSTLYIAGSSVEGVLLVKRRKHGKDAPRIWHTRHR